MNVLLEDTSESKVKSCEIRVGDLRGCGRELKIVQSIRSSAHIT